MVEKIVGKIRDWLLYFINQRFPLTTDTQDFYAVPRHKSTNKK